jgi:hypothetical protein
MSPLSLARTALLNQFSIIRGFFMVPVSAVASWLSHLYYHHAVYFQILRDRYEAFAIASFFTLLCNYIPKRNLEDPKKWIHLAQHKSCEADLPKGC